MEIIYNSANNKPLIMNMGNFDGVHCGHRHIIELAVKRAKDYRCNSALLTFNPHPVEVLTQKKIKKLSSWQQRKRIFFELGLDMIVVQRFDNSFAQLEYTEFIKKLTDRFNIKEIIVGDDFRCGYQNAGTLEKIAKLGNELGYELTAVPSVKVDGRDISSTYIRKLLESGKIRLANKLLNRNFALEATVINGDKRGRKLGFPTANLEPVTNYVSPKAGVYAARVVINNKLYNGVANLGFRPTFNKEKLSIEVHIFDFDQFIYKQKLELSFVQRIRKEKKFRNKAELVETIESDIKQAKKILL